MSKFVKPNISFDDERTSMSVWRTFLIIRRHDDKRIVAQQGKDPERFYYVMSGKRKCHCFSNICGDCISEFIFICRNK